MLSILEHLIPQETNKRNDFKIVESTMLKEYLDKRLVGFTAPLG